MPVPVVIFISTRPPCDFISEVWALYDKEGSELARGTVTVHPGDMSWKVTRAFEEAFESVLVEGWMDE